MSNHETIAAFYQRTLAVPDASRTAWFLRRMPNGGRILDFGCGSGRWAAAFRRDRADLTIDVLDQHLNQSPLIQADWPGERYQQSFEDFIPSQRYDGIWAYAALFFLSAAHFERVLERLAAALVPGGTFFFTMVAPGARSRFHGMCPTTIEAALARAHLQIEGLESHHDEYGTQKQPLLTHHVTARRLHKI